MTAFRIHIIFALVFAALAGCNRGTGGGDAEGGDPAHTVSIHGTLEDGAGKTVLLDRMGARELTAIDTVLCDEKGSFQIAFTAEEVAFYALHVGGPGYITLLIEPGESLEITGTYGSDHPYRVKGSEGSALLAELASTHKKALDALGEISRENRKRTGEPGYAEIRARLDERFDSVTRDFTAYSERFIREHPGSLAILVALYNLYGPGLPVFSPETHLDVYRFVDSALMSQYDGFEAVGLLHAQIQEADRRLVRENPVEKLREGDIAPDFVSSQPDGEELALSDLRGNYVLLGFWAGWSKPSRDENAILKRAYARYRHQPFRILQVSLDSEREVWLRAIEEDQADWDHVSDLNRWESPAADLYRVDRIPSNVLIGPGGRIIATDLFGDRLLERLKTIFES